MYVSIKEKSAAYPKQFRKLLYLSLKIIMALREKILIA